MKLKTRNLILRVTVVAAAVKVAVEVVAVMTLTLLVMNQMMMIKTQHKLPSRKKILTVTVVMTKVLSDS